MKDDYEIVIDDDSTFDDAEKYVKKVNNLITKGDNIIGVPLSPDDVDKIQNLMYIDNDDRIIIWKWIDLFVIISQKYLNIK